MKIFIIRLKNNELSCGFADEAKKSVDLLGLQSEFFDGVESTEARKYLIDNKLTVNPNQPAHHISLGTLGCFSSHHSLWKRCADENIPYVILEHDAILLRDPEPLVDIVDDVCHLDNFIPFNSLLGEDSEEHFNVYDSAVATIKPPAVIDYPKARFYDSKNITGSCFRGLYGYLLKPQGASKIMDFCSRLGVFPADRVVCENSVHLQKSDSSFVRLNPFFKSIKIQRTNSTR